MAERESTSREDNDSSACGGRVLRRSQASRSADAWKSWLGIAVVYAFALGGHGLLETTVRRPARVFGAQDNPQIAEAKSWWNGRLDLAERQWDTAVVGGRYYSHFPILFSVIAAVVEPLFGGVPRLLILIVIVLPIPYLAFRLFRAVLGSPGWAALPAIVLVCGTSLWPVLDRTLRHAHSYFVNHTLATVGLLIVVGEIFGKRRLWPACVGLVIAVLSRQMTIAYFLPVLLMAREAGDHTAFRRYLPPALAMLFVLTVNVSLNTLKFGHPTDVGYLRLYEGRDDPLAEKGRQYGLFAAHYVPENLYYMNVGLPRLHRTERAGEVRYRVSPNTICTGIWWTTPILLFLFFDLRRILSDSRRAGLLVAAALIFAALLFYHSAGQDQRGFNRYSLDFMPGLLALVAPISVAGRAKWVSIPMVAWSVLYFRWLI